MEVSSGRRRLVIREMELNNFKSYAGLQKVGPFHKVCLAYPLQQVKLLAVASCSAVDMPQSFSSVVGPNGSGKSNVIDAMLFVFGKRAKQVSTLLKTPHEHVDVGCACRQGDVTCHLCEFNAMQLRLSKVSELIHNSTHHRNLEMAVVSVHFQEIIDLVRPTCSHCFGWAPSSDLSSSCHQRPRCSLDE